MQVKKTFALIGIAATISIGFGWLLYKYLHSSSVNVATENTTSPNDAGKVANPVEELPENPIEELPKNLVEETLADKIDKKVKGSKTTIECLYHIFNWSNDDIKKFVRIDKKNSPADNVSATKDQQLTPTAIDASADNARKDLEKQENDTDGTFNPKEPLDKNDSAENLDKNNSEQASPIEAMELTAQNPEMVEPLQETEEQQLISGEDVSSTHPLENIADELKNEVSAVSKNVEDIKTVVNKIQEDLKDQKVPGVELEKQVIEDKDADQHSNEGKDDEPKVDNVKGQQEEIKDKDEPKGDGDDQSLNKDEHEEIKGLPVDQQSNEGKEEQEKKNDYDEYNQAIQNFDKFKNEMEAELEGNGEEYKLLHAFISSDPIITNPEDKLMTLDNDMVRYLDDIKHDLTDILNRYTALTPNMLEEKYTIDGKLYSLYELVLVKVAQATGLYSY